MTSLSESSSTAQSHQRLPLLSQSKHSPPHPIKNSPSSTASPSSQTVNSPTPNQAASSPTQCSNSQRTTGHPHSAVSSGTVVDIDIGFGFGIVVSEERDE